MYKVKRFSVLRESTYTTHVTKAVYGISKPFTKDKIKLGRKLINKENNIKSTIYEAATNPGGMADKAVREVSRNPVTGSLVIGGNVAAPVVPGITEGAIAVGRPIDKYLRKKASGLYRVSEKVGDTIGPIIGDFTNSAINYARTI